MKYEIIYTEIITQEERNRVYVEADTEEEAIELVIMGEFDEIEPLRVDVVDNQDFELESIKEI